MVYFMENPSGDFTRPKNISGADAVQVFGVQDLGRRFFRQTFWACGWEKKTSFKNG